MYVFHNHKSDIYYVKLECPHTKSMFLNNARSQLNLITLQLFRGLRNSGLAEWQKWL